MTTKQKTKSRPAEILREYGPYPGMERVHGVTFDGKNIWFARGESLVALDPQSGAVVRELEAAVTARGAALLDVPVSGSTITVEQGQASFIAGGDAEALERVRPWLQAMGTAIAPPDIPRVLLSTID